MAKHLLTIAMVIVAAVAFMIEWVIRAAIRALPFLIFCCVLRLMYLIVGGSHA